MSIPGNNRGSRQVDPAGQIGADAGHHETCAGVEHDDVAGGAPGAAEHLAGDCGIGRRIATRELLGRRDSQSDRVGIDRRLAHLAAP